MIGALDVFVGNLEALNTASTGEAGGVPGNAQEPPGE